MAALQYFFWMGHLPGLQRTPPSPTRCSGLIFAESQIFGRGAQQRMRTISHACKAQGCVAEALLFLRDRVVSGPPRRLACQDQQTYHLYTDAASESDHSGMGGILFNESAMIVNWFSEAVPPTVLASLNSENKKGFIYELEACAAVQGVLHLCAKLKNHNLIVYCDNEAALAAMIRCRSESPLVASQLAQLSAFEEVLGRCPACLQDFVDF